jgi:hypothetical protein
MISDTIISWLPKGLLEHGHLTDFLKTLECIPQSYPRGGGMREKKT